MPKAVIYVRVSTQEQVSNLSLSTQEKECRTYCERHGFEVDRVFTEEGESAKTTNRTAFREMLGFCKSKKAHFQCLVVYSLSRFSRDKNDHFAARAYLHSLGVTLRSVTCLLY